MFERENLDQIIRDFEIEIGEEIDPCFYISLGEDFEVGEDFDDNFESSSPDEDLDFLKDKIKENILSPGRYFFALVLFTKMFSEFNNL